MCWGGRPIYTRAGQREQLGPAVDFIGQLTIFGGKAPYTILYAATEAQSTREAMGLRLGDTAPNFQAEATGYTEHIDFYDWTGSSWCILFSHPADFTPVCTTELGQVAKLKGVFDARNAKVIALSVDRLSDHDSWSKDIEETQGQSINFPIIADEDRRISTLYDMLDQPLNDASNVSSDSGLSLTVRSVFFIDPAKRIRLILTYPAAVGRNFDEVVRCLDALQLADGYKIATPVNWTPGNDVIVRFDVSDDEANTLFEDVRTVKPYLRYAACPNPKKA